MEVFTFYVNDDRTIKYRPLEPIMQEDKDVAVWRLRIPKVLNNIDMSNWAWWFVYVNAKGQKFSELLTLNNDIDDPEEYSIADYSIGYGISKTPGGFTFALEAINTSQDGEISGEWHTRTYTHTVTPTLQGNQAEYAETESDVISALMQEVRTRINQVIGGATPLPVSSVSEMTDTSKVYLLTTDSYWYYYNGTQWTAGGLYGAGIQIDPTLSQRKQAADAFETGQRLGEPSITEFFEVGNITINATEPYWTYAKDATRVRTKRNTTLRIHEGTKIGLKDYSNARYFVGVKKDNDEYYRKGWLTSDYITEYGGEYVIVISSVPSTTQTSADDLASLFFGYVPGLSSMIADNSDAVETFADLNLATEPGYYNASGGIDSPSSTLLERHTAKIPCEDGYVFKIHYGPTSQTSGLYLSYCLFDENESFLERIVSLNAQTNEESITVTIDNESAKYIGFSYRSFGVDDIITFMSDKHINIVEKMLGKAGTFTKEVITPLILPYSEYNYVDFVLTDTVAYVTIPADTVIVLKDSYKVISSETRINLLESGVSTSAIKLIYKISTNEFSVKGYSTPLSAGEVLICTIRRPPSVTTQASVNISCSYALNGYKMGVPSENPYVKAINHRGWTDAPENTLPAYKESKKHGFNYVETDIQFTSDDVPVCLHDPTINRTARNADGTAISSTINVYDATYEQLLQYDFGIYKNSKYAGTKIPTFEGFLMLCRNLGLCAYIELKSDGQYTESQVAGLVNTVKQFAMEKHATWISFSTTLLGYVKTSDPNARLGLLTNGTPDVTIAESLKTQTNEVFIDAQYTIEDTYINNCINAGIPLEVWTVDNQSTVIDLNPYISGVTSNKVIAGEVLQTDSIK